MSASVLMSNVLASPGTPVIRQCPPVNSAMRTSSTASSWPTMTLRSSARICCRPSATFSAVARDWIIRRLGDLVIDDLAIVYHQSTKSPIDAILMRERIDDLVDGHLIRHRRELQIARVFDDVRPLP